jgi:hypothetical protein
MRELKGRTFLAGHCSADILEQVELKNLSRVLERKETWTLSKLDRVTVVKMDLDKVRATFR